MNIVERALRRISKDLRTRNQGWALVGGFAVSARAEPRFTRDVDVAVAVTDDAAAEGLIRSLFGCGYQLLASVEHETSGRLATARLTSGHPEDDGDIVVDVLFASSGIETEVVQAAESIEVLPGLTVPVAQLGHLIALKILARDDEVRPQDLADLRSLLAVATQNDLQLAKTGISLITERGFHRDRDLAAQLAELTEHP